MNNKIQTECWRIEGRWENTREPVAEVQYFTIDQIGGSLDDAKRAAQNYLYRRVDRAGESLEWIASGTNHFFAYTPNITFRITR